MKKLSFWGLVALLSLSLSIPAFAKGGQGGGGNNPGYGNPDGTQQRLRDGSGQGKSSRKRPRDGSCLVNNNKGTTPSQTSNAKK
jgi:hypothetical protein